MSSTFGILNPLRYRGYVYDTETSLYYLQSRYYNPEIGRFINADSIGYLGIDGNLVSFNLFAYCGNNPITGYDPSGHWNWRTILDVAVTVVATVVSVITASATKAASHMAGASKKQATIQSVAVGIKTFGDINNGANAFYYNHISRGESSLETTCVDLPYKDMKSDYVDGYVNRWDRLDYTKKITQSEYYDANAKRFQSEYAMHMHLWNIVEPFQNKGIWLADRIGKSAKHAHIDPLKPDPDWKIQALTGIVSILGI